MFRSQRQTAALAFALAQVAGGLTELGARAAKPGCRIEAAPGPLAAGLERVHESIAISFDWDFEQKLRIKNEEQSNS